MVRMSFICWVFLSRLLHPGLPEEAVLFIAFCVLIRHWMKSIWSALVCNNYNVENLPYINVHIWWWYKNMSVLGVSNSKCIRCFIAELVIFIAAEMYFSTTYSFHSANIYMHGGSGRLKSSGILCCIEWWIVVLKEHNAFKFGTSLLFLYVISYDIFMAVPVWSQYIQFFRMPVTPLCFFLGTTNSLQSISAHYVLCPECFLPGTTITLQSVSAHYIICPVCFLSGTTISIYGSYLLCPVCILTQPPVQHALLLNRPVAWNCPPPCGPEVKNV